MFEFLELLMDHVSSIASCLKVCVECFLVFVKLKKHFNNKTPKKQKPTNSRRRTAANSTPSKKHQ